jgi:methionyl-tRNA formyltransferase
VQQRLRIAFAGTPAFAVPALDALAASRHELVGVLTQPDRPAGRGRALLPGAVKQRAAQLGLPIDQPVKLANAEQRAALERWRPDLLVVVAYGLLLPAPVLALPRLGCLNIHASLLPRWRGAAPIQRALLAGDAQTGVAIMALEATLDTGPVYASERVTIGADETAGELQQRLAVLGAAALLPVVEALAAGTAHCTAQSPDGVTHAAKLRKEEAVIDWSQSSLQIERQVRAFNPWPVAETMLGTERVRIWRARALPVAAAPAAGVAPGTVLAGSGDGVTVACGTGSLAIHELQLPGKRVIQARDFAHGRPLAALCFGAPVQRQ